MRVKHGQSSIKEESRERRNTHAGSLTLSLPVKPNVRSSISSNNPKFSDIQLLDEVFDKLRSGVNGLQTLSFEGIERVLENCKFTDLELELVFSNILTSKEIAIPLSVRKVVHYAAKTLISTRNSSKFQESFATKDTARFCKVFYKPCKLDPVKGVKVKTRTNRTLITKDDRKGKGCRSRTLSPTAAESGFHSAPHLPYQEFGRVQLDPRDMFVANLRNSLPKIAKKTYYQLRSEENKEWKAPSRVGRDDKSVVGEGHQNTRDLTVNIMRTNTFYIDSGYGLFTSYNREAEQRIKAVQNGGSPIKHWIYSNRLREQSHWSRLNKEVYREMDPQPATPVESRTEIIKLSTGNESNYSTSHNIRDSILSSTILNEFEREMQKHWTRLGQQYVNADSVNGRRRFIDTRIELFKTKLSGILKLMSMLKNMRMYHLRQKRLSPQLIKDLQVDPLRTRDPVLKKIKSDLHYAARKQESNMRVDSKATSLSTKSKYFGRRPTSKHSNTGISFNFPAVSSASQRLLRSGGSKHTKPNSPNRLDTWEDFLALNPKDALRGIRSKRNVEISPHSLKPSTSSYTSKKSRGRLFNTPSRTLKSDVNFWKILKKKFLIPVISGAGIRKLIQDVQRKNRAIEGNGSKQTADGSTNITEQGESEPKDSEEDQAQLNMVSRLKFEWIKSKITLTTKMQTKLRRQYNNTIKTYKAKRKRLLTSEDMVAIEGEEACPRRSCRRSFFKKVEANRVRIIEEKQEMWDFILARENNFHRAQNNTGNWTQIDEVLRSIFRFADGIPLRNIANNEDKMRLITQSLPAYDMLLLPIQLSFKFVLGNVLFIDPMKFDNWMKERGMPIHPSYSSEPVIPKARMKELNADYEQINKELRIIYKSSANGKSKHPSASSRQNRTRFV